MLWLANRLSKRRATDPSSQLVVTMTTHGTRIESVYFALESIVRGKRRPRRLILWLDDPTLGRPDTLRRLQQRGVEVLLVEPGWGVHTKYFPYVASSSRHEFALVTSDDDMLYPASWLAGLERASLAAPEHVHCYRAHHIELDGESIGPYLSWTPRLETTPSFRSFGTSVSGQVFPPRLLDAVRDAGTRFLEIAPDADDVWLHSLAVANGFRVGQVSSVPQNFPFVPGTQASGLYFTNSWGDQNDVQVSKAYGPALVAVLRGEG
ncbi:MAG: hypothetical protein ACOH10_05025 [Rhodoglobus sp.]